MPKHELPPEQRRQIADEIMRRTALALLTTPGLTPAERLHTLECVDHLVRSQG